MTNTIRIDFLETIPDHTTTYGAYDLNSGGNVVWNPFQKPWRAFNSLIVMHLEHLRKEGVNTEVVIEWAEDR